MKKDRKKEKQTPLGVIAAIVIIFLAEIADSAEGLGILIFIAVIVGIVALLVNKLKPKAETAAPGEHGAAAQRRKAYKLRSGDTPPFRRQ